MFLTRKLAQRATLALAAALSVLAAACQPEAKEDSKPEPVSFGSSTLPAQSAEPGEILAIEVKGSGSEINAGFLVEFDNGTDKAAIPPFHVEAGKAYVLVPPFAQTDTIVNLALIDMNGDTLDRHPQPLTIHAFETTLTYTRGTFDAVTANGLSRLVMLAVETVDTLLQEGLITAADANVASGALGQQADLLQTIGTFNNNLSDAELAVLQQLLDNSEILDLLAHAGGVSLTQIYSSGSPLYNGTAAMIESALLKADFASLLMGEIRGVMALLAWAGNALANVPVIGQYAQQIATWAAGVSATLQTPHDLINTLIPSDLVRVTAGSTQMTLWPGSSGSVLARGRFETEQPFNMALFQQTVGAAATAAASWITQRMQQYPTMAQYAVYVQQLASMVPQWLTNWMTQQGFFQQSVVPGSNYTVLVIDNFNLYMGQYRFSVGGIVANLLNVPYSVMSAILSIIGLGMGAPLGGWEGVRVSNSTVATYNPNADTIWANARGGATITCVAPHCRPAGGWWAQWGFYTIKTNTASIPLTVN
ncbi:MAG: hypothetical protein IT464_08630 [Planctomycetes bacterium]|nr:hypothetical protein [Planctomycetota bacterium]